MDDGTVVYPTAALRSLIEDTARDTSLTPTARVRELQLVRDDVNSLLGLLDTRLGEATLVVEAESIVATEDHLFARENADLREELLRRRFASEEQLDRLGYLSHAELDRRIAAGEGIDPASLNEALGGRVFERLHRRDRRGRWVEMPDAPEVGKTIAGGKVKRVLVGGKGQKHFIYETPKVKAHDIADMQATGAQHPALPLRATKRQRVRAHGVNEPAALAPRAEAEATPRADPGTSRESVRERAYRGRAKKLRKRIDRAAAAGTRADKRQEEGKLNLAGQVGQQRVLDFAREVSSSPTTTEMHATRSPDGEVIWDKDRQALHHEIIRLVMSKRLVGPDGKLLTDEYGNPRYDPSGEPIPSPARDANGNPITGPDGKPVRPGVLFTGGGYAAGKSSVLKSGQVETFPGVENVDYLKIDPDEIKSLLPEYAATYEGDPEANLRAYEEAWYISQQVQKLAQQRELNVVVDGISNTSPDEMLNRVQSFVDAGYENPRAVYVDVPTDVALERAAYRAEHAESPGDRRHIPEIVMRSVHRDVAATVPRLMDDMRAKQLGLSVQVYDANVPKGTPPVLLAERTKDQDSFNVRDPKWSAFTAKAAESIDHITEQMEPVAHDVGFGQPHLGAMHAPNPAMSPPTGFQPGMLHHAAYFNIDKPGTQIVPLSVLEPTKPPESQPDSVANARTRMLAAAAGEGGKRDPITVERIANGRFRIVDGNATYGAARELGWDDLPVVVVNSGQGNLNPGIGGREETRRAMGQALKVDESTSLQQPVGPDDEDRLYEMAEAAIGPFSRLLNEGVGLSEELGADTSKLAGGKDAFARSLERAKENVINAPERPHVIIGAIKDRHKAAQKAGTKDNGWQDMRDLVRGSILVPDASQLPQVAERLQQKLDQMGWKIAEADNGWADPEHSTKGGYIDTSLTLQDENGFLMELQLHSRPMWLAKEVHGGHEAYDQVEKPRRAAINDKRPLTAVEGVRIANAKAFMPRLYDQAIRDSFGES